MRLPDWEARLAEYLAAVRTKPHRYGEHDCALHGASAAAAITGVDNGAVFRGRYSTELGAARALRMLGAGSLEAEFDSHFEPIAPALAGRGDLVLADSSVGVCVGSHGLFVGDDGLIRIPRAAWAGAWRV